MNTLSNSAFIIAFQLEQSSIYGAAITYHFEKPIVAVGEKARRAVLEK